MKNSNNWDVNIMRKIAGLPLMEAVDDDDDEDPDAKIAMGDKRQAAFEKRNKSELSTAEKEANIKEKLAKEKTKEARVKKAEDSPVDKKESPVASPKAKEKSEDAADTSNEAKRRGRAPSDTSKRGQARTWINGHPSAKRSEFLAHAESFGMTKHYANAFFYTVKKSMKVEECYVLSHPSMPSFMLAENREINQMQWIDPTSPLEPMIFESRAEAEKVAKYMGEWKSQYANIDTIKLVD